MRFCIKVNVILLINIQGIMIYSESYLECNVMLYLNPKEDQISVKPTQLDILNVSHYISFCST